MQTRYFQNCIIRNNARWDLPGKIQVELRDIGDEGLTRQAGGSHYHVDLHFQPYPWFSGRTRGSPWHEHKYLQCPPRRSLHGLRGARFLKEGAGA
jgi:hypothetical protein